MSGGMLDYDAYLKLPATDEYLNNKERLQRLDDESTGIFKVLSKTEEEKKDDAQSQ